MRMHRAMRIAALSAITMTASVAASAQTTTVVIDGRSYEIDDDRPLVAMPDGTPGYADETTAASVAPARRGTTEADSVSIAMSSVEGTAPVQDQRHASGVGREPAMVPPHAASSSTAPRAMTTHDPKLASSAAMRRTWPAELVIPARSADGSYMTPNRGLSRAASVWHMRVALNVAALGCRGYGSDRLVSGYNDMLSRHRRELAVAQNALAREYGVGRGRGRRTYDDSMTRLYNFWATPPAQEGFCRAAIETIDAMTANDASGADLATLSGSSLARLDEPFTAFFREYEAWRSVGGETPIRAPDVAYARPTASGLDTVATSGAFTPVGRRR